MHVTVVHALKKPDPCTALLMFDCFHLELLVLLLTNYMKLIRYKDSQIEWKIINGRYL